ncbi:tol-pal system YbgF family protein [Pedobacter sp. SYP-B3415]|uniref:tetratricopeptide repeat protein n=1 Tax=Pedobacter sp. SYP-B3415 TaxID=2496641 RepID=UPI00101B9212|nr:tetratricopeptide repeat protein [Pedobacter sp. SYP-B3415]
MLKLICRSILLPALVCLSTLPVRAAFDFNANCLKAYRSVFDLKLANARAYLNTERKLRPGNDMIPLLENYIDYFDLLSSDSKKDFDVLKGNKSRRLDRLEDADSSSPYYLFAQAEINLQWALIRGRFGEYFNAAMEIRKANALLRENKKKFPDFPLNNKGLGLIDAVLGSMPDGTLKSALSVVGIKGNTRRGIDMMERLASTVSKTPYEAFYEETAFYYTYVLADVVRDPAAYAKTIKYTAQIADSSLLRAYLQAYVAIKTGHSDKAITFLKERPRGGAYEPFPYLDYLEGVALLNKLDLSAENAFERFLTTNKGVNYIKDANLRLGWIALIRNQPKVYSGFAGKAKSQGFTYIDKDKQAQNEAGGPTPDRVLLQARLLSDGGFTNRAAQLLQQKSAADFGTSKDRTEFAYRLGRIAEDTGKDQAAIEHYRTALQTGRNLPAYFAANAALRLGKIFENAGDKQKAKEAYESCIALKNHEYESSIEGEAKSGLKRLVR